MSLLMGNSSRKVTGDTKKNLKIQQYFYSADAKKKGKHKNVSSCANKQQENAQNV